MLVNLELQIYKFSRQHGPENKKQGVGISEEPGLVGSAPGKAMNVNRVPQDLNEVRTEWGIA